LLAERSLCTLHHARVIGGVAQRKEERREQRGWTSLLVAAGGLAALIPAWRASRLDPTVALPERLIAPNRP
jgi:hypothetical protein